MKEESMVFCGIYARTWFSSYDYDVPLIGFSERQSSLSLLNLSVFYTRKVYFVPSRVDRVS